MKNRSIVFIIIIPTLFLAAQPPAPLYDREMDEPRDEKMEMMVMWKLTEDLELTEKQAETFFPKFRAHQEKMAELREEGQKYLQEIRKQLRDEKGISDKEVENALNTYKELEIKKSEARVTFVKSLKGTLSNEQRAKLILAPHEMRREAMRNIKEHKKFRNRREMRNRWR